MNKLRLPSKVRMATCSALFLLSSMTFALSSVTIQSVDNYAGYSNVYTNAPNTEVKITELDHNKNPVRSWTGTTDEKGKITIPAGSNLSKPYLRAERVNSDNAPNFVLPSELFSGTPFSFTANGSVEGQVVTVYSESGEVVTTAKSDDEGRVFLPLGLAAGAYTLESGSGSGRNSKIHSLVVRPLLPETPVKFQGMQIGGTLSPLRLSEALSLAMVGANPDASKIDARFVGGSEERPMKVLAATPGEIVLASPRSAGLRAGDIGALRITDQETLNSVTSDPTLVYDATSRLTEKRIPSGSETHLVIEVVPSILIAQIEAKIVSGPVSFENGAKRAVAQTNGGVADFMLFSTPGAQGKFKVDWTVRFDTSAEIGQTNAHQLMQQAGPSGKKAGHTIKKRDGGWTDEYTDTDSDGKKIGSTKETFDKNGTLRERTTARNEAGGGRTTTTDKYDEKGKWTESESKTYDKDGKQTGGTKTSPDGKGGVKTETWDPKTGTYK